MKYLLLLIFAFYSLVSTAQSSDEAYIVDSDGYTNVRKAQSSTSAIITTIKTAELFECEPNKESSWWKVRTSNGTSGFIHKSRIVTVVSQAALISDLFEEIRKTNPNNVEFGEVSNEELFMFAEQFPKSFLSAFHKADREIIELITKELESPIHDLIDLKLIHARISDLMDFKSAREEILRAIEQAGKNMGVTFSEN